MERIKVEITKETKKAYIVQDAAGRQGWIQRRWLGADSTVAAKTFEKAVTYIAEQQQARAEAKDHANAFHQITKIIKETEKAVAVEAVLDFCDVEKTVEKMLWIPKSLIKSNAVPGWFVVKKIDELLGYYRENFNRYGSVILDSVGVADFEDCFAN